jgi:peptidoglycan/LPS O-acetylase OafA/YrhL
MTNNPGWIRAGLRSESIAQRYMTVGGFTHGFDYIRLILAVAVILQHSVLATGGAEAASALWMTACRCLFAPILLMFFALSGFLVAGSVKKGGSRRAFVVLRVIRLVPALAVEVLLCALVLGPILTNLPLDEYFSHRSFFSYFGNIVGFIKMFLPGVFLDNPFPGIVNISLWTVPYELECYLALMALWLTGLLKKPWVVFTLVIVCAIAGTAYALAHYQWYWTGNRPLPNSLIVAFLAGLCLNLFSAKIRLDIRLALLALAVMIFATLNYQTVYIAALAAAYLVVYLGMMHPPKKTFLLRGDYSYGLYIFAFPIQQAYSQWFVDYRFWYLNAIFTLVFGLAYAAFSWWLIEKPILSRKKVIVAFVERFPWKKSQAMRRT